MCKVGYSLKEFKEDFVMDHFFQKSDGFHSSNQISRNS